MSEKNGGRTCPKCGMFLGQKHLCPICDTPEPDICSDSHPEQDQKCGRTCPKCGMFLGQKHLCPVCDTSGTEQNNTFDGMKTDAVPADDANTAEQNIFKNGTPPAFSPFEYETEVSGTGRHNEETILSQVCLSFFRYSVPALLICGIVKWLSGMTWGEVLFGGLSVYLLALVTSHIYASRANAPDEELMNYTITFLIYVPVCLVVCVFFKYYFAATWEHSLIGGLVVYLMVHVATLIGIDDRDINADTLTAVMLGISFIAFICLMVSGIIKQIFDCSWWKCLSLGFAVFLAILVHFWRKGPF